MSLITLAGTPVVLDYLGDLQAYLDLRLPAAQWPFAEDSIEHQPPPLEGVAAQPNLPGLPQVRLGEVIVPGAGASRYARSLQVMDTAGLQAVILAAWDLTWDGDGPIPTGYTRADRPITLRYWPRNSSISDEYGAAFDLEMYLLPPIQLDGYQGFAGMGPTPDPDPQLWLLPLVDIRYLALHYGHTVVDIKSASTWEDVTTELTKGILPVDFTEPAEAAYQQPDPGFFSYGPQSWARMVDIVAESTGRRAIWNGNSIELQNDSEAQPLVDGMWVDMPFTMLGGPRPRSATTNGIELMVRKLTDYWWHPGNTLPFPHVPDGIDTTEKIPPIVSTYFHRYHDKEEQSDVRGRIEALADALGLACQGWDDLQYTATWAGVPSETYRWTTIGSTDYVKVSYDGTGEHPTLVTSVTSIPTDWAPQINVCQEPGLYVHANELVRVNVTNAIPEGTASGPATITNKSDHNYDGDPDPITVHKVEGTDEQIDAGSKKIAFYQLEDGWYVNPTTDTTQEAVQRPWVRFRLLSDMVNRQATAVIELLVGKVHYVPEGGGDPIPYVVGDEITISDPLNHFPSAIATGTGTAYYRTTTNSNNVPSGVERFEVEMCTLPISVIDCKIKECLLASDPTSLTFECFFGPTNYPPWMRSNYNNADIPPEFVLDETEPAGEPGVNIPAPVDWKVQFKNTKRLDVVKDTIVRLERQTDHGHTDPGNTLAPKAEGDDVTVVWEVIDRPQDKQFARWLGVEAQQDGGNYWTPTAWWEGSDPRICDTPVIECGPGFDCACIKAGNRGIAFYAPGLNKYYVISTTAAVLGVPEAMEANSGYAPASDNSCEIEYVSQPFLGFKCGAIATPKRFAISSKQATMTGQVTLSPGTGLCVEYDTVSVCDTQQGTSTQCVDLCAWICEYCDWAQYVGPAGDCMDEPPECNCIDCAFEKGPISLSITPQGGETVTQVGPAEGASGCTWLVPMSDGGNATVEYTGEGNWEVDYTGGPYYGVGDCSGAELDDGSAGEASLTADGVNCDTPPPPPCGTCVYIWFSGQWEEDTAANNCTADGGTTCVCPNPPTREGFLGEQVELDCTTDPPPPPQCGECTWLYQNNTWILQGNTCTGNCICGPKPVIAGTPGETKTTDCIPDDTPPTHCCSECGGDEVTITNLYGSAAMSFDYSQNGDSVGTSNCSWDVPVEVIEYDPDTLEEAQRYNATARVTFSGTDWNVAIGSMIELPNLSFDWNSISNCAEGEKTCHDGNCNDCDDAHFWVGRSQCPNAAAEEIERVRAVSRQGLQAIPVRHRLSRPPGDLVGVRVPAVAKNGDIFKLRYPELFVGCGCGGSDAVAMLNKLTLDQARRRQRILADSIVLGMDRAKRDHGVPIPYSRQEVEALLLAFIKNLEKAQDDEDDAPGDQ